MEDFLNFILIFSPMVFMDVLHSLNSELDSAWWKLRRAVIYFVRGPLVSTGDIAARRDARKAAATDMWDVAVILQQQAPTRMMTLNLRLAVVHLAPQEEEIGAVSNAIELYLERRLFVTKSVVPAPITGAAMDTYMGNASLLRDTVDDMQHNYPGIRFLPDLVHEHAADSLKGITDIPTEGADIKTIYFFLGTGYQVVRNGHICSPGDEHGDKVHEQLAEYVRSLSSGGSNLDIERDGLDVTRYQRYQCGYEVITSQVYARARSRISYNVSLEPCEADNFSHASVDAYYLVSNPTNGKVVCRLAMAMAYPTMEHLDESVIDMSHCGVFDLQEDEKRNIVLPISRIQTKVILHRPPGYNCPIYATYLWSSLSHLRCHE